MKKVICVLSALTMLLAMGGCAGAGDSSSTSDSNSGSTSATGSFDSSKAITVVARDAASGTRSAFHELMGIIQKDGDTEKDMLVTGALEFDSTDKVITAVEGDAYGIGYISLGSVSDRIKTAKVDGVEATAENVKNGTYSVSRPFLLVTKGEENDLVKDFISFINSKQGQAIVADHSYITVEENAQEYTGSGMSGTIKIAGSTSVQPLMEVFTEEYKKLNPDVSFEIQAQGSSQGIKAATDGSYDIGMSSRELKEEEKSVLNEHTIALDGIAVILNKNNPMDDISSENITAIYTGTKTKWSEVE